MSVAHLVGTGVSLGVVHVLTGPDHLSALAALSANENCVNSMFLGLKWGIGHSLGMMLVAYILISIAISAAQKKHQTQNVGLSSQATKTFQAVTGTLMLVLGMYAMWRAFDHKNSNINGSGSAAAILDKKAALDEAERNTNDLALTESTTKKMNTIGSISSDAEKGNIDHQSTGIPTEEGWKLPAAGYEEQHSLPLPESSKPASPSSKGAMGSAPNAQRDGLMKVDPSEIADFVNVGGKRQRRTCLGRCCSRISTGGLALCTGIIHGIAGPGGVLGVIPAVQLMDWRLSSIYLLSFCAAATVAMTGFASFYGTLTLWMSQGNSVMRKFWIESFSASLSILVGIIWLSLLATGKLEKVFSSHHAMAEDHSNMDIGDGTDLGEDRRYI